MKRLEGKVALITGASRGQGAAAARCFVAEGARVVLGDVLDCAPLAHELGDAAVALTLDVTQESHWLAAVALAETHFGALHVLLNNAGIVRVAPLLETSLDDYRAVIEVNQTGCFLGMRVAAPAMIRAGGGAIVNVSSVGGTRGMADAHAYAAAKAGVINLTRSLAKTYGPENIRSNCFAPGVVDTGMIDPYREMFDQAFADPVAAQQICPLGRMGTPEEAADCMFFLAVATYCNGSVLVMDGGSSA